MPDPTRPVDAAEIETAWGQAVHDATFTPKGVHITGGTTKSVGVTPLVLYMDVAVDDPGGWASLATEQAIAPTGAGGVYLLSASMNTVNGDAGTLTRAFVYLNGTQSGGGTATNAGATNVKWSLNTLISLTAADTVEIRANVSSGAAPDVSLLHFWLMRMGTQMGA